VPESEQTYPPLDLHVQTVSRQNLFKTVSNTITFTGLWKYL